jgi:hypothetical protein
VKVKDFPLAYELVGRVLSPLEFYQAYLHDGPDYNLRPISICEVDLLIIVGFTDLQSI